MSIDSVAVTETWLSSRACIRILLLIIIGSRGQGVIPRTSLTVKHLIGLIVADSLGASQIVRILLLLKHASLLFNHLQVGGVALFESLCVSKRIQSMIT